jgi:RNA polymerase sigma-70 factor (ECF subfamily)
MAQSNEQREQFSRTFASQRWAVRNYLARRAPAAMVDDLVAETFLVAWRRFDRIPPDPLTWLLGTARRVLANELRGQRRRDALIQRLQLFADDPVFAPPDEMIDSDVRAGLEALPMKEREALLLVAWEGLDPGRAAQALGCSDTAFRVRLHRARRRMAARFELSEDEAAARCVTRGVT